MITGCNGQLGTEMQKRLREEEYIAVDRTTLPIENITSEWLKSKGISHIVNCAAYTAVDAAESHVEEAFKTNAISVGKMAAAAAKANVKVLHISTDYVFDGESDQPYSEDSMPAPLQVYGQSKLMGEQLLREQYPAAIILRTQWLYSPYRHNFVKTILRLAAEKKPLRVVNDQKGSPTSARSLANVVYGIITGAWIPGIYNYSNTGVISWYDFACEILKLGGYSTDIISPLSTADYPTVAERPTNSVLNKTKIIKTYALHIPDWRDELRDCIEQINQI